ALRPLPQDLDLGKRDEPAHETGRAHARVGPGERSDRRALAARAASLPRTAARRGPGAKLEPPARSWRCPRRRGGARLGGAPGRGPHRPPGLRDPGRGPPRRMAGERRPHGPERRPERGGLAELLGVTHLRADAATVNATTVAAACLAALSLAAGPSPA